MSFPNIPDINSEINVTFEEAVNLLLLSIAKEEMSLSELMDAEKNKLLYLIHGYRRKRIPLHDVAEINRSVNSTIQSLVKMQMLLHFKLDDVRGMLASTTTSTTSTTTVSTSTCSTTVSCPCGCNLECRGYVVNPQDEFYSDPAYLRELNIDCAQSACVRYCVRNDDASLELESAADGVCMEYPSSTNAYSLVVSGDAHVEKSSNCASDISVDAEFRLTIRDSCSGKVKFRMEIASDSYPEIDHDSGFMPVRGNDAWLRSALQYCLGQ